MMTLITTQPRLLALPASMLGDIESVIMQDMGIMPMFSGAFPRGIHAAGDMVTKTADGVDLNAIWNEFQASLAIANEGRDRLVQFLTYPVSVAHEDVFQGGATAEFEDASEYGLPVGYRPEVNYATMGYDFSWKDLGGYYTWQFLAQADAAQVRAFNNMALEADSRSVFLKVMRTLFNNARRTNKEGNVVYPFYNGQNVDEFDTPPQYGATTFPSGHNHFLASGASTLDQQDVEGMEDKLTEHGYTGRRGYRLVLLVNKAQGDTMRNWRSTANSGSGLYDFVPANNTPASLMPVDLRAEGPRPPAQLNGFDAIGSYGQFVIIQEDYIPAGYLVGFATGGTDALPNPIAFREHAQANLRGLRLVKGRTPDYPLIDSVYNRGFGTGIRHRGAGVVLQVTAGSYSAPSEYAY